MTFLEQVASDMTNVFLNPLEFATTWTYTPTGGSGAAIYGVFEPDQTGEQMTTDGRTYPVSGVLMISSVVTEGVVSPALGDNAARGGVTYQVIEILPADIGMHSLRVQYVAAIERSHASYRIPR